MFKQKRDKGFFDKVYSRIMEKASGDNPLKEQQKESNRAKSSIWLRGEHIFGFIENSMNEIEAQMRRYYAFHYSNRTYESDLQYVSL